MHKRAFIYDLDNTIYPVQSIAGKVFASLFKLIEESSEHTHDMKFIKEDIMRKPFQKVAAEHHFSENLTQKGIGLLKDTTYDGEIKPFADYPEIRRIKGDRFLVTTGFAKLQNSKIGGMRIAEDFNEIHIVDPSTSNRTKKDVFEDIIKRNNYKPLEVLVIGDDPESEIKAAQELGIDTVLYDKNNSYGLSTATYKIDDFKALCNLFNLSR